MKRILHILFCVFCLTVLCTLLLSCGDEGAVATTTASSDHATTTAASSDHATTTAASVPGSATTVPSAVTTATPPSTTGSEPIDPTPSLPDIEGVTLTSLSFPYDGQSHSLAVTGALPAGATVSYTGNGQTDAGTYPIGATVSAPGYRDLTLNATLTVTPIAMGGLQFEDDSFEYDTREHSITVTGLLPTGAVVRYSGGENGQNGATNVGKYTISVRVTAKNYNPYTATATLTITSKEELLQVAVLGNTVLFQNSLDSNRLYASKNGVLTRVSNDVPIDMAICGNRMYLLTKTLLSGGISVYNGSDGTVTDLMDVKATGLCCDGTYLYYCVSSLTSAEKTGIFRVSIADLENQDADPTPVRVAAVKAENLVVNGGILYFSNKSDGGKLYAVSAAGTDATPKKLYDYKISDLIVSGNTLYFTREVTLSNLSAGAAVYSIDVSSGSYAEATDGDRRVKKITMSKGKYLTAVGDSIYFVNTDMVTTRLAGDGVYCAPADGSGWVGDVWDLLTGASKVFSEEDDTFFSLASDGTDLYYFRTSTKHLYRRNLTSGAETDLMAGFVPPEQVVTLTTFYEKTEMYDGALYYINMRDGGRLYRYDPVSRADQRLTSLQVADFAVHDGYLYYSTVRLLVNFDLYRMSLISGETDRLSTDKCMNFSFDGDYLYYTNYSGSNTLNRMKTDGTADEVIYSEESVSSGATTIYMGKLYFVADDRLCTYDLATGSVAVVNKDIKPLNYLIYDQKILFMNTAGFSNSVGLYDLATGTLTKLDGLGVSGVSDDVRGMFVRDGKMYYYRNVAAGSSKRGLYRVDATSSGYSAVKVDTYDGYYLCYSIVSGDTLYFSNVWLTKDTVPTPASDGYLYTLNLKTGEIARAN